MREGRCHFPSLPVERACQLLGMTRASYYRPDARTVAGPASTERTP